MTIVLDNLTVGYDRHPAVHHLSGNFDPSTLTAIIGPNGGGKSTLLKALMGMLRPMSGSIHYNNISMTEIAYLPQTSDVDRSFPLSVKDVALLGNWPKIGGFRSVSDSMVTKTLEALSEVGMAAFADRPISALSTGQWQRVLFARLIVQDARVLLLDEPFASIDGRTTHDLMHILQDMQKQGRIVIAVMHDLPLVKEHFQQALMLAREKIAWGSTNEVLEDANLSRASVMASRWVENADTCERVS